ncbi:MAG: peptidase M4, partial [Bacteroidetes bacterium CG23_combo_of_CG06-09_8_20_14_all_32_9]
MKTTIIFLLVFLIPSMVFTQVFTNKSAEDIVKQSKTVRVDEKSKKIKFIKLKNNSLIESDAKAWLVKTLHLSVNHEFRLVSQESDKLGYVHNRYNLYYKNVLVENDRYYTHSKGIWVTSANGEISIFSEINVEPGINQELAFKNALEYIKADKYLWDENNISKPKGELIILPVNDKYVLTYKFDIYAIKPLSRNYVYVDANSGKVVKTKNRIISSDVLGTAVTKYCGTKQITTDSYAGTYRLREAGRGGGIETYDLNNSTSSTSAVDFTDSDNYWNTTTNQDNAAYDAHYSAEMTYDYYFLKFGRNSYDNAGAKIFSYVHCDYSFVNAYWDGQ